METIIDDLKNWIEKESNKPQYLFENKKITVLLNGDIDGYVASKLAIDIFGKENVISVIIPCYSTPECIEETFSFSKENEIKHKIIGIKHVYDSIIESDDDASSGFRLPYDSIELNSDIIENLRNTILESINSLNSAMIFKFELLDNLYHFNMKFNKSSNNYFYLSMNKDIMKKLAADLKIDEKYIL